MTFKVAISKSHFLTYSPDGLRDSGKWENLPPEAWGLIEPLEDDVASHVVLATEGRQLVGFFRCTKRRKELYAQGTWVDSAYRRAGVASVLWDRAIKTFEPETIYVYPMSRGGLALVKKVQRRYLGVRMILGALG